MCNFLDTQVYPWGLSRSDQFEWSHQPTSSHVPWESNHPGLGWNSHRVAIQRNLRLVEIGAHPLKDKSRIWQNYFHLQIKITCIWYYYFYLLWQFIGLYSNKLFYDILPSWCIKWTVSWIIFNFIKIGSIGWFTLLFLFNSSATIHQLAYEFKPSPATRCFGHCVFIDTPVVVTYSNGH